MKPDEIQIGDWLHLHYSNKFDGEVHKNFRVGQIRNDYGDMCVWAQKSENAYGNMGALEPEYGESNISPIPITEEFLAKNFQKRIHYGIFDDYFDFEIWEYTDSMYIAYYHNCEFSLPDSRILGISYVHELQHVFKMFGIEKEVVL